MNRSAPSLEDDGKTAARRLPLGLGLPSRVAIWLAAFGVVALVLLWLGVAGYRYGFAITAGLLAGVLGASLWVLLADVEQRTTWTLAAAVAGLVAAGLLVELAPPSAGALEERLDNLALPFYTVVETEVEGNSRCSPRCPVVARTYRSSLSSQEAAASEVILALQASSLPAPEISPTDPVPVNGFTVRSEDVVLEVSFPELPAPPGERFPGQPVRIELRARR